jgi:hypothetical protein
MVSLYAWPGLWENNPVALRRPQGPAQGDRHRALYRDTDRAEVRGGAE